MADIVIKAALGVHMKNEHTSVNRQGGVNPLVFRSQAVNRGHNFQSGPKFHLHGHHEMLRFDKQQRFTVHFLHEEFIAVGRAAGNGAYKVADFSHLKISVSINYIELLVV